MTHIDAISFALKSNVVSLKTQIDKLDIDKLVSVPVDLSKLNNVVKNDVVKKTLCDKLVEKVNNIDTKEFVFKTTYDTDKSDLVSKIPNITGLAINFKLTGVENKISETESKVNNHDHDEYITTSEFNKLTVENFKARLA